MTNKFQKINYYRFVNGVSKVDANYYRLLIKQCIDENEDVLKSLDNYYEEIIVYFFKTGLEREQLDIISKFFKRNFLTLDKLSPASATSENNKGLIIINIDEIKKSSSKRGDIKNIENYYKIMMFEEVCHLIEQKGSAIVFPESAGRLFTRYDGYLKSLGKSPDVGFEIIKKLDENRNHYEVYTMMKKHYPDLFFERFSSVAWEEGSYKIKYDLWKKTLNQKIALARALSDFFYRKILFIILQDFELYHIPPNKMITTLNKCKTALNESYNLINSESPQIADALTVVTESVFQSPEQFFDYIYNLWDKNEFFS